MGVTKTEGPTAANDPPPVAPADMTEDKISPAPATPATPPQDDASDREKTDDYDSDDFQNGVQRVRAITTVWSRPTLISMFILLYLVLFVDFVQNANDAALNPYITSSFGAHGLLNVVGIMSTILGGCVPLALAKAIDIFGRIEGYLFSLLVAVAGMIMKATCVNVEMYFAAHVLYWTGHIGLLYIIDVMVSDITTLKNRMIIFGINGTPRIASTFAGPAIAQLFYEKSNFRWAFGAFAIIIVGFSIPALGVMIYMFRKATAMGVITSRRSPVQRAWYQSIWYYFIQFDIVGIILIMFAFSLILLPFSLAPYAPNFWSTPYIIAMEVLGVLLVPAFYAWEKYLTPVPFLPWKYLTERTIVGSCLLYGAMFLSTFCWNRYFYSYLMVVNRQSMTSASYILNAFSLTSSVFGPIFGVIISKTGNFKWFAYTGVPIMLIGTGLLIPFRAPSTSAGVLALTQVLVGFGTGIFVTCGQIAVMSPVSHQEIAVVNAIWGLFGGIGAAIGMAIAGALWNNIAPTMLHDLLPESAKSTSRQIFGDIELQMSFADGSPERDAIVATYFHVQRLMVISGACFVPLCLICIFVWKNINVKKLEEEHGKQTKGLVF